MIGEQTKVNELPRSAIPWRFDGKVSIVTGASSGMGIAIAHYLGLAGARVVLVGRDRERLAATTKGVRESGAECIELAADITADGSAERVVEAAVKTFGRVDSLVHNAGVLLLNSLEEATTEELDIQYRIHLRAPFELTKAALPHLGKGSSIVFIGSNLVHHGLPGSSTYSASKGGVEALARTFAIELAPRGIRVNVLSPGVTRTPMTVRITDHPEVLKAVLEVTPIGRLGEVEDIAAAVAFLISDAAGFIVGATLLIDGGQSSI